MAPAVYYEVAATIIVLVLLGRLLESRARARTSDAIRRLDRASAARRPDRPRRHRAHRAGRRASSRATSSSCGPGERLAGRRRVARRARPTVDESMLTGESLPVEKEPGSAGVRRKRERHGRVPVPRDACGPRHRAPADHPADAAGAGAPRADRAPGRRHLGRLRAGRARDRDRHLRRLVQRAAAGRARHGGARELRRGAHHRVPVRDGAGHAHRDPRRHGTRRRARHPRQGRRRARARARASTTDRARQDGHDHHGPSRGHRRRAAAGPDGATLDAGELLRPRGVGRTPIGTSARGRRRARGGGAAAVARRARPRSWSRPGHGVEATLDGRRVDRRAAPRLLRRGSRCRWPPPSSGGGSRVARAHGDVRRGARAAATGGVLSGCSASPTRRGPRRARRLPRCGGSGSRS